MSAAFITKWYFRYVPVKVDGRFVGSANDHTLLVSVNFTTMNGRKVDFDGQVKKFPLFK